MSLVLAVAAATETILEEFRLHRSCRIRRHRYRRGANQRDMANYADSREGVASNGHAKGYRPHQAKRLQDVVSGRYIWDMSERADLSVENKVPCEQ